MICKIKISRLMEFYHLLIPNNRLLWPNNRLPASNHRLVTPNNGVLQI